MTVLETAVSTPLPAVEAAAPPRRPFRLTRTFSIASLIGILVTATAMALIYRHLAVEAVIAQEMASKADLAQAFTNMLWKRHEPFLNLAGQLPPDSLVARPEIAEIDADTRRIMDGLSVIKVKIYSPHGITIFSTEARQIGDDKLDEPGFMKAMHGQVASKTIYKEQFYAMQGVLKDRDLMSTYLPVRRGSDPTIIAVTELYSDLTPLLKDIRQTEYIVMAAVAGPMLLLYLFLLVWVRNSDRIIKQHEAEERRLQDQLLDHVAQHDGLTGLPNRTRMQAMLVQAMMRTRERGQTLGVFHIDIDRFKLVSDNLGQEAGDQVLISIAERIVSYAGEHHLLARVGGDEFVLIMEPLPGPREAERIAETLGAILADPIPVGENRVELTVSIGIALYPDHEDSAEGLIRDAEAAVQRAKSLGRGRYAFYTEELNAQALQRFELENGLRRALEDDRFEVYYQPRVDAESGHPLGAEALLRWHRVDGEPVGPDRFIPILEDMGLIQSIGGWVLRMACRQCRAWHEAGHGNLTVSVNLSLCQLRRGDLVEDVRTALVESGLEPSHLELEITESALAEDVEKAILILRELKQLGVHLALDDFGTGYSSLSHLMHFPLDCLKIDRSFVRDTPDNREHVNLTTAIAAMARSLGLRIVAEGVETEQQRDFLRGLKVEELQGYLYSKPVPAADFQAWLATAKTPS